MMRLVNIAAALSYAYVPMNAGPVFGYILGASVTNKNIQGLVLTRS